MVTDPGVYVLTFRAMQTIRMTVGKLSRYEFVVGPGLYAYVGSARGGLANRIWRHLNLTARKSATAYHIDRVTTAGARRWRPLGAVVTLGEDVKECDQTRALEKTVSASPITGVLIGAGGGNSRPPRCRGFGDTDCERKCGSHLFRIMDKGVDMSRLARRLGGRWRPVEYWELLAEAAEKIRRSRPSRGTSSERLGRRR